MLAGSARCGNPRKLGSFVRIATRLSLANVDGPFAGRVPGTARECPGPDATLRDRVHGLGRHAATFSHLCNEVLVEPVHVLTDLHALLRCEPCERRVNVGILAGLHRFSRDTDFVEGAFDDDLPREDADRTRQSAWLRDDCLTWHRDVVTAGCREVGH